MKKQLSLTVAVLLSASVIFMSGCKKDDTTPPVVSVTGSNPMTISLNSTAPADPGATATDDKDGAITKITSDWSTTNPNVNLKGSYTIKYSATDAAGNEGTATRTVNVINDADAWAGTYLKGTIVDSVFSDAAHTSAGFVQVYTWQHDMTVTASTTVNKQIIFSPFSDYSGIAASETIYGNVVGTTVTVPSQTAHSIGSPAADHTFQGAGTSTSTSPFKFKLNVSDQTTSGNAYDAVSFSK